MRIVFTRNNEAKSRRRKIIMLISRATMFIKTKILMAYCAQVTEAVLSTLVKEAIVTMITL